MNTKPKIAWVIDFPINGSGGHKTWFYYINELVEKGYEVDIYVNNPHHNNPVELKNIIGEYLIPTEANIKAGWDIKGNYDVLFATWYRTAKLVADYPHAKHKMYFVQDVEQYFNPMGDEFMKAVNTYKLGLKIVTMGRWLSNHLNEEYNAQTYPLFLGADTGLYTDPGMERENIVSFIYQPEKPRRCPGLVYETIKRLRYIEPGVRIVTYGASQGTGLPGVEHWGLVPFQECVKLYARSKVGVCFSSTNPSRIPFEMMATGLPVVELHRDNNLYDISEKGSLLVEEDSYAAAAAIKKLLNDQKLWKELSAGGKEFMEDMSIEQSVKEFIDVIEEVVADKPYQKKEKPLIYTKPAIKPDPDQVSKEQLMRRKIDEMPHTDDPLNYGSIRRFAKNQLRKERDFLVKLKDKKVMRLKAIKQYARALATLPDRNLTQFKTYELFSSDVFDTIVRRSTHPDEVKYATAHYLYRNHYHQLSSVRVIDILHERQRFEGELGEKSIQSGGDFEYEISEVFKLLVMELLGLDEKQAQATAKDLVEFEQDLERHVLYPDPQGIKLFNSIKAQKKILLSDFYMRSEDLQKLFDFDENLEDLDQVITSIDHHKNKHQGNIFTAIEDKFSVEPKHYLHTGDNKWSDVGSPKSKGINGHLFVNPKEETKRRINQKAWEDRQNHKFPYKAQIDKVLDNIEIPSELNKEQRQLFKAGIKYSPIFYFFVANIIENCIKEGLDTTYYFTREGIFYKKVHEAIARHNPFYSQVPRPELLEVSRVATFAPSIRELTFEELKRVWNQYSEQSLEALAITLGLKKDALNKFGKQYKIDPEETCLLWQDDRFQKLFENKEFRTFVNSHIKQKKDLILAYLKQKGLDPKAGKKIGIVDIGWRGTIQDNLSHLLPEHTLMGFYFGMVRPLNYQPTNTLKIAYGPNFYKDSDYFLQLLNGGATFLEMLSNSTGGSSVAYKKNNGKVESVKEISKHEDEHVIDKYITFFQQGVLAATKELASFSKAHSITSEEARKYVLGELVELIHRPPYVLTNVFFNLKYSETFGVGSYYDMKERSTLSKRDLLLSPISHSHRKRLLDKAAKSQWIHGYWKYNDRTGTLGYLYRQYFYNKEMARNLARAPKQKLKQILGK